MKRKLRLSTLIVLGVLMLALLIGGLYGYFDDTETSTGNVFTAGTLNLVATDNGTGPAGKYTVTAGGDGINGNVVFDRIAPGDNGTITWTLSNTGNINGTLSMVSAVTFGEGVIPEPELTVVGNDGGGNGDLDQYVGVKLQRDGAYILGDAGTWGAFANLQAALNAESRSLVAGGAITYVFTWNIDSSVGNIIQGDTADIGITFALAQA